MVYKQTDGTFFGTGGMLRSAPVPPASLPKTIGPWPTTLGFGKQPVSAQSSQPAYGFGSSHRDQYHRTYMSADHDKAKVKSAGGNNSQGAIYKVQSAFGTQPTSDRGTSPTIRVGSEQRKGLANKSDFPGPGTYRQTSAIGRQQQSTRSTSPRAVFGMQHRDAVEKQFLTKDHEQAMQGRNSPGPSAYNTVSAIGRQPLSSRQSLPQWRMGSEGRFNYDHVRRATQVPGAGQYEAQPTIGKQAQSAKATLPSYSFGSSTRDQQDRRFVTKEHEKSQYGRISPGPTTAGPAASVGRQAEAPKKSSANFKFGHDSRFKGYHKDVPGPGAYAA